MGQMESKMRAICFINYICLRLSFFDCLCTPMSYRFKSIMFRVGLWLAWEHLSTTAQQALPAYNPQLFRHKSHHMVEPLT